VDRFKLLAVSLSLVFLFGGFIIGQREASAGNNGAGSSADPLVTKSYVDAAVNEKFKSLEKEIRDLRAKIDKLENTVSRLQQGTGTVNPPAGSPDNTAAELGTAVVIEKAGAILRNGPDTTFSRIGALPHGTRVTVLKESNGWYQVKTHSGATGWVYGGLLKIGN